MFPAINFAIYLVIVVRFLIPAMRDYLQKRDADIIQATAESSAQLTRAQADLVASQARLAQLPKEADDIRQDLIAIATRQGERLKAQAEETGARRLAGAALLAEQERRRALDAIGRLATAATRLAEGRIRVALTSTTSVASSAVPEGRGRAMRPDAIARRYARHCFAIERNSLDAVSTALAARPTSSRAERHADAPGPVSRERKRALLLKIIETTNAPAVLAIFSCCSPTADG